MSVSPQVLDSEGNLVRLKRQSSPQSCGPDGYLCPEGDLCVIKEHQCNGIRDCLNGEDEDAVDGMCECCSLKKSKLV